MATTTRVVGNEEGDDKGSKGNGDGDEEDDGNGNNRGDGYGNEGGRQATVEKIAMGMGTVQRTGPLVL